ncbi:MAG: peptidase M24 [Deltaproteobacteria bacterium CG_4_8_14_3_um_filter_51_11]|nr:aminopeptidase P family protein [bacterium]OIP43924.1 MAG: hypothetical protein AUK25_00075 [Desulfobacteraceae bacterium CG2_30_51_40]PIP46997.1 MAG: peptidase M24 [Deltaproteobacteria bacterium CG23_combo_of_CG06-09_8_20_14_all_51_20]PIX21006.1 MAG: peptidase M24 [Deltaproteobacteria bacterium CG_4_8_14_3_um_filter_51_11]PIY22602.1 MAG: peptidase M24 [Deltaproteobacteria bacterium CG_4_10_14_3_um_filter_51_14]PJB34397.1 MAG: peptidase M24 [Deltaproteobacteria bacterium CG_4_9_14_3_um_filt
MDIEKEREARIKSILSILDERKIDALWVTGAENRRYLSGFRAEDSSLTESSGSLFIVGDTRIVVTDSRFTSQAEAETRGFEIYTAKDGIGAALDELTKKLGVSVLGFEEEFVTWGLYQRVSRALSSRITLVPLGKTVESLRAVKSKQELDMLRASADMISSVLSLVIESLAAGMTEREAAFLVERLAREAGADCLSFPPIVASGPNSALPHAIPSERRFIEGEPIILDVGVRLNGYCSDITRTVFLGKPSAEFALIYNTVKSAQAAGIIEIREGVLSTKPDAAARTIIKDAGFEDYFGHSLGHGIGLAAHEEPRLSPKNPQTLTQGMAVTVEPGIYIPGKGGVRIEEMVVVEEHGCRIITSEPHLYQFSH